MIGAEGLVKRYSASHQAGWKLAKQIKTLIEMKKFHSFFEFSTNR